MVPIEVNKMGGHTGASVMIKIKEDFLRTPDALDIINRVRAKKGMPAKKDATTAEKNLALTDYVKLKTKRVMRIAKGSAMAINSMGTGAMLSFFFGFLFLEIGHQLGWIPTKVMEIASTVFNSPTEVLSTYAQTVAGNYVGLAKQPKLTSTDAGKNELMLQMIFDKAVQQMGESEGRLVPITYGELHSVYRPILTFTAPLGEGIVKTYTKVFDLLHFAKDTKKDLDASGLIDDGTCWCYCILFVQGKFFSVGCIGVFRYILNY